MNQPFIQVGHVVLVAANIVAIYRCGSPLRTEVLCVGLREAMVFRGEQGETLWQWAQSVLHTQCLMPMRERTTTESGK
jgi:hypothetical protein